MDSSRGEIPGRRGFQDSYMPETPVYESESYPNTPALTKGTTPHYTFSRSNPPLAYVVPTELAGYDRYTSPPAGQVADLSHVRDVVESYEARKKAGEPLGETEFLHTAGCLTIEQIRDGITNGHDMTTIFNNNYEAQGFREQLRKPVKAEDPTLPVDNDEEKLLVKALFIAFKSIAKAEDKEGVLKSFQEERHVNEVVEALCWQLLVGLECRAVRDGPLLMAWEPERARKNTHSNFAERFNDLIQVLLVSKTVCRGLYQAPKMNAIVDDPVHYHGRVRSNRKLNDTKAKVMKVGKEVLEEENAEEDSSPRRSKRARKAIKNEGAGDSEEDEDDVFDDGDDLDDIGDYNTPARPTRARAQSSRRATKLAHRRALSTSRTPNKSPIRHDLQDMRLNTPVFTPTTGTASTHPTFPTNSPLPSQSLGFGNNTYQRIGQTFSMLQSGQYMNQQLPPVTTMPSNYPVMPYYHRSLPPPIRSYTEGYQGHTQNMHHFDQTYVPQQQMMQPQEVVPSSASTHSTSENSGHSFADFINDENATTGLDGYDDSQPGNAWTH